MSKRTDGPSPEVKIRVLKRDRFQCTYCGKPGTDVELEIDHIIAVSNGGSHHISNLTTACRSCNQKKGDRQDFGDISRTRKIVERNSLIGMFVLTFKDGDGIFGLHLQGQIIGFDGEFFLLQTFSWVDGEPHSVVHIDKETILNEKLCRIFQENQQMINAADDIQKEIWKDWYRGMSKRQRGAMCGGGESNLWRR